MKRKAIRQFYISNVKPSADGQTVLATIHDRDFHRFVELPADVQSVGEDANGNPIVRFPRRKLVQGNVLDLDR